MFRLGLNRTIGTGSLDTVGYTQILSGCTQGSLTGGHTEPEQLEGTHRKPIGSFFDRHTTPTRITLATESKMVTVTCHAKLVHTQKRRVA